MQIRPATEADLPAILTIFNRSIETSLAIWVETPATIEERHAWFSARRSQGFPVLVAEDMSAKNLGAKNQGVLGFGSFGAFRPYEGFRITVEHSVYVSEQARGRGVGRALLAALIDEARDSGKRVIVGAVDSTNDVSLAMHRSMGFIETGRMPRVGEKHGHRLDMVLLQKEL
jgi:phosphinothricin acetyltransferase